MSLRRNIGVYRPRPVRRGAPDQVSMPSPLRPLLPVGGQNPTSEQPSSPSTARPATAQTIDPLRSRVSGLAGLTSQQPSPMKHSRMSRSSKTATTSLTRCSMRQMFLTSIPLINRLIARLRTGMILAAGNLLHRLLAFAPLWPHLAGPPGITPSARSSCCEFGFIPNMPEGVVAGIGSIRLPPCAVPAKINRTQPVRWSPRHHEVEGAEQFGVLVSPPEVVLDRALVTLKCTRQSSNRIARRSPEENISLVEACEAQTFGHGWRTVSKFLDKEWRMRNRIDRLGCRSSPESGFSLLRHVLGFCSEGFTAISTSISLATPTKDGETISFCSSTFAEHVWGDALATVCSPQGSY